MSQVVDVDQDALITPEAAAMVGHEIASAAGKVEAKQFQRWAAAVKDRNPLYFDAEYARAHGYRDVIAPRLYAQYAVLGVTDMSNLRPDGTPGNVGTDIPLPACPRRMAGGDNSTYHAPLYDGDEVIVSRVVDSIVEKHGRSGRFVLVTFRTTYRNQHGELVEESTASMIARP